MTQYRNPEWSGTRLNMSTIDAAYTVLQSDSSKVFMLDGGGYTITLPVVAALEQGWHCKFVVRPANPTGDIVITATTAIVDLVMKDPGGDASNSTAGTAKTTVIFHTECTQGDYVNIFTDGSTYYAEAMSGVNDAIDHTQQ
jgi:hypothetical protein